MSNNVYSLKIPLTCRVPYRMDDQDGHSRHSEGYPKIHDVMFREDGSGKVHVGVRMRADSKKAGHDVRAWLNIEDYHRILSEYGPVAWCLNGDGTGSPPYVRASRIIKPGLSTTLARFIARAEKNEIVRYIDGNKLNLLRHNLITEKVGKAPPKAR